MGTQKSRYLYGKQEKLQSFQEILEKVKAAKLPKDHEAYFWLLYYTGARKSEAYERVVEDVEITESHFIIDFHQRKKHGAEVPPLELPRAWPGVELLVKIIERAREKRARIKRVYYAENKEWKSKLVKAHWLFPDISKTWAWRIVKKVLGKEYYPHFLRLNRLSEIGSDPKANLEMIKSFSGIKSLRTIESYLGVSKKEQKAALNIMDEKIRET